MNKMITEYKFNIVIHLLQLYKFHSISIINKLEFSAGYLPARIRWSRMHSSRRPLSTASQPSRLLPQTASRCNSYCSTSPSASLYLHLSTSIFPLSTSHLLPLLSTPNKFSQNYLFYFK